ncbi:MAG: lipid-A-disaccharide synthase [Holosporales bacterium]|nr:lipid-A-disaccharide synthase [Holosporales bacterium]
MPKYNNKQWKIYIIAGEPSGDAIGASVLRELNKEHGVTITGVGGYQMAKEGLKSLFDIKKIAVGGIFEIIPHILRIIKLIKLTACDIVRHSPDVILTIDSPGFCFRVIKKIQKLRPQTKTIHLVAPSVWAWRPKRAKKLSKLYDELLTLFDFEPQYFQKYGLKTECVGHPLAEEIVGEITDSKDDVFLLIPGSRAQEIKTLLPIFLKFSDYYNSDESKPRRCIIPTLPHLIPLISKMIGIRNIEIVSEDAQKNELYHRASLAIAASGTATLQLALSGCPMIVCYKLNNFTYNIIKKVVKIKYISLVNIILDKEVVPELIQHACNVEMIHQAEKAIDIANQRYNFKILREKMKIEKKSPVSNIIKKIINLIIE